MKPSATCRARTLPVKKLIVHTCRYLKVGEGVRGSFTIITSCSISPHNPSTILAKRRHSRKILNVQHHPLRLPETPRQVRPKTHVCAAIAAKLRFLRRIPYRKTRSPTIHHSHLISTPTTSTPQHTPFQYSSLPQHFLVISTQNPVISQKSAPRKPSPIVTVSRLSQLRSHPRFDSGTGRSHARDVSLKRRQNASEDVS